MPLAIQALEYANDELDGKDEEAQEEEEEQKKPAAGGARAKPKQAW